MFTTGTRFVVALTLLLGVAAGCSSTDGHDRAEPAVSSSAPTEPRPSPVSTSPIAAPTLGEVVALRDDVALVNVRPRDTPFDSLTPWPDGIGYVRAWGGSRGMVTFPTESAVPSALRNQVSRDAYDVVSDNEIDGLLALQGLHAVRLVYMVNVNDTIESQLAFIDRMQQAGLDIAMFEMGNELYLPKFERGDTSKLGVTRSWSEAEYLELLGAWGPALRVAAPTVPIYAIAAAHGATDSASDQSRTEWNRELLSALGDDPDLVDGVTFHVYTSASAATMGDGGEEPAAETTVDVFDSIHTFGDLPVAITESGYGFTDADTSGLEDAEQFWTSLRGALRPGDLFGVHVMYSRSNGPDSPHFALFDDEGRTAVGDRFATWLSGWAAPN